MDPATKLQNDIIESERHRRTADLLLREATLQLEAAAQHAVEVRQGGFSFRRAFEASGSLRWGEAPVEREASDRLAKAHGATTRTVGGFFIPDGLATRALQATSGSGAYAVAAAAPQRIEAQPSAGGFLRYCTIERAQGPTGHVLVGRFDEMPVVTVLANEASSAADQTPEAGQTILKPKNHATYVQQSRQLVLQTGEAGARGLATLIANALRNHAQLQVLTGDGTNGALLGLCNDPDVPTDTGGTLAFAKVAAAIEDVESCTGGGDLRWVVTAPAAAILRQREVVSGGDAILKDGRIGGYPCTVVGGTSDAVAVFGRWSDLFIHEWAPFEIALDPYAGFASQRVGVRGWATFDAAPLVTGSFSTITAIT